MNFNQDGVEFLKRKVVERAYKDFKFSYKWLLAYEHKDESPVLMKRYQAAYDKAKRQAGFFIQEKTKTDEKNHRKPRYSEKDIEALTDSSLKREYDLNYDDLAEIVRFLESDKFLMYSDVDPKKIYGKAKAEVEAWYQDCLAGKEEDEEENDL